MGEGWLSEGDPKDLPKSIEYAKGWRIPKPDLVLEMAEDYVVPAEGEIAYQYFVMDPQLTEDKWVVAAQCVPGNSEVVHHIIAFVLPPEIGKDISVGHFSASDRRPPGLRLGGGGDSGRRHPPKKVVEGTARAESANRENSPGDQPAHPAGMPNDMNKRIAIMRSLFTNYLVAMAPGTPPMILHDGMAKKDSGRFEDRIPIPLHAER